MTDKQPEALARMLQPGGVVPIDIQTTAALVAEIERLTSCLKWEQNRAERIGTHAPGCEKWGPAHYECLLRAIERKDALLRQAVSALELYKAYGWPDRNGVIPAITSELAK